MHKLVHGVLVALLSAGALAGCGSDDPPEAEPPASPTETTGSPSESGSPTQEPSPTVEPASGPRKSFGSLTMSFPEGFDVSRPGGTTLAGTGAEGHIGVIAVETITADPLDKLARDAVRDVGFSSGAKRLPDLEADGVTMYHVAGPFGTRMRDLIGVEHGGFQMQLAFTLGLPKRARMELIESVLASITWS